MSYVDLIQNELRKVGGYISGYDMFICCPFHGETRPSLGVSIAIDGKVPLGTFSCFGCGESGSWNKLARKLGMEQVDQKILMSEARATIRKPSLEKVIDESSTEEFLRSKGFTKIKQWPDPSRTKIKFFHKWYTIPGEILHHLGAYLIDERKEDHHRLFLPVRVYDKVCGGVRVLYEKRDRQATYLTTEGDWVKSHGLLPYDFVWEYVRRNRLRFVVIVEGPRDALRLLMLGIPAIAVLGSKNFSDDKALLLGSLPIDTIYVMPDSDRGGRELVEKSRDLLKQYLDFKVIKLPKYSKDEKGERVVSDPQIVSEAFLKKVIKTLEKIHKCRVRPILSDPAL